MVTFREKFVASDAWMLLWMLGSLGLSLYVVLTSLEPSVSTLQSPLLVLLTGFAVLATIVLNMLISPFLAFCVFDRMIERQTRRNGGPFSIGDRVVVIAGRYSGKEGIISSYGQCRTLRVTVDGEPAEFGSYSHYQLKRVAEQSKG